MLHDDLSRLVKQAVATPPVAMLETAAGEFHPPNDEERNALAGLESKIRHRIE